MNNVGYEKRVLNINTVRDAKIYLEKEESREAEDLIKEVDEILNK